MVGRTEPGTPAGPLVRRLHQLLIADILIYLYTQQQGHLQQDTLQLTDTWSVVRQTAQNTVNPLQLTDTWSVVRQTAQNTVNTLQLTDTWSVVRQTAQSTAQHAAADR